MTRTRRVNGEGTYYVDSKKGLASWRRNYIDRFGCKKRKSIYAKSKLELKPLIKKWEEELARNILPEDENLTVKDWLDIWLERFIKPNTKIRTYDNYNSCIDQYLKPQFGKEKLKKLTPLKIQAGLNDLLKYESKHKNMLSLKTVMNARMVLKMACYKAIAEGIIPTNPVNSTKLPAYHKKEACIPSEEEVNNLLKIAEEGQYIFYDLKNDNSYKLKDPGVQYLLEANKVIVLLAITSGMRLGELFGLTWNNVDFANNSVSVTHTLTAASTGTCLGLPKTFESIRTIPLPHQTINKLQGWKKYQGKYAQNLQDIFVNKNNLVFPNSFGNFMSVSNWHVRYWKKMMGVAGWKGDKNPHILRHLYISTLIRNKIPILYVAKIAGHTKSALITLKTYAHVIEAQNSEMAGAIDKIYALKTPNANSTQSKIEKANG